MKCILPILGMLCAMSCSTGEKSAAANDTTAVDTTKLAAVPTPEVKSAPAANPVVDKETLFNILVQDQAYLPKDATYEFTSSSTIQLDKIGTSNMIQGISVLYETVPAGDVNEPVDMIMLAFFDVSTDTPTLIAQKDVGEQMGGVTINTVELTPGQFAVSVTVSAISTNYPAGKTVEEERDLMTYYALNDGEIVPIFEYVCVKKSTEKSNENVILETKQKMVAATGAFEQGTLCPINITITGTSDNQVTELTNLEPITLVYTFNGTVYQKEL